MEQKKHKLKKIVGFRLSEEDHTSYMAKVKASHMKPSEFFRKCVLDNTTQIIVSGKALTTGEMERRAKAAIILRDNKPVSDLTERQLLFLISQSSNNLTQLSHRANSDHFQGLLSEATYIDILESLQVINQTLKAVL